MLRSLTAKAVPRAHATSIASTTYAVPCYGNNLILFPGSRNNKRDDRQHLSAAAVLKLQGRSRSSSVAAANKRVESSSDHRPWVDGGNAQPRQLYRKQQQKQKQHQPGEEDPSVRFSLQRRKLQQQYNGSSQVQLRGSVNSQASAGVTVPSSKRLWDPRSKPTTTDVGLGYSANNHLDDVKGNFFPKRQHRIQVPRVVLQDRHAEQNQSHSDDIKSKFFPKRQQQAPEPPRVLLQQNTGKTPEPPRLLEEQKRQENQPTTQQQKNREWKQRVPPATSSSWRLRDEGQQKTTTTTAAIISPRDFGLQPSVQNRGWRQRREQPNTPTGRVSAFLPPMDWGAAGGGGAVAALPRPQTQGAPAVVHNNTPTYSPKEKLGRGIVVPRLQTPIGQLARTQSSPSLPVPPPPPPPPPPPLVAKNERIIGGIAAQPRPPQQRQAQDGQLVRAQEASPRSLEDKLTGGVASSLYFPFAGHLRQPKQDPTEGLRKAFKVGVVPTKVADSPSLVGSGERTERTTAPGLSTTKPSILADLLRQFQRQNNENRNRSDAQVVRKAPQRQPRWRTSPGGAYGRYRSEGRERSIIHPPERQPPRQRQLPRWREVPRWREELSRRAPHQWRPPHQRPPHQRPPHQRRPQRSPSFDAFKTLNKKREEVMKRAQDHAEVVSLSEFLSEGQRKSAPVGKNDGTDQEVMLPSYAVSLAEASQLLRTQRQKLRRVLVSALGEKPAAGLTDEEIMVDTDTMELMALEVGRKFRRSSRTASPEDREVLLQRRAAAEAAEQAEASAATGETTTTTTTPYELLAPRPPVVCVMGHVDHGKTTLMDTLRRRSAEAAAGTQQKKAKKKKKKSGGKAKKGNKGNGDDIAGTEAGGITQVISAFQVPLEGATVDDRPAAVTFLDTPGHAAFKAMRQSGSDAADVIVLVVAADDGVSEQTIEILDMYKSIVAGSGGGGISMVVAMNKIDKPGIDVEESRWRIVNQLLEHGIPVEGTGNSRRHDDQDGLVGPPVQLIPVSGLAGDGIDDLIEGLVLQSEIMDLRADRAARGEGVVMDARVEQGEGVVVDCIIRWGTIRKGSIVVSGTHKGNVRALKSANDNKKPIKEGLPSQPVRVIGFESAPKAGEPLICVASEELAQRLVERRSAKERPTGPSSSDEKGSELQRTSRYMMVASEKSRRKRKAQRLADDDADGGASAPIRIPVVIKADADGSLRAIRDSLVRLGDDSSHDVFVDPIGESVGPVEPGDLRSAKESGATIVCFNVATERGIAAVAEEEGIALLSGNVIYSLLDEAKWQFAEYLPMEPVEKVHGRAEVKAVFDIGGIDNRVAGLKVLEGTLFKGNAVGDEGRTLSCRYRVRRGGELITATTTTAQAQDDDGGTTGGGLVATSLKHFKDDVEEVGHGKDCGLSLEGHDDYEEGDEIECFSVEMKRSSL